MSIISCCYQDNKNNHCNEIEFTKLEYENILIRKTNVHKI